MQAFAYHKDKDYPTTAAPPRSATSTSTRPTKMRPMRSICWRCQLLRPDRRGRPRSGPDLSGAAGAAHGDRTLSRQRIRPLVDPEVRSGLRPSRRQGDGDRALLPQAQALSPPRSTGSASWSRNSRPRPTRRGAVPAGRGLPVAGPDRTRRRPRGRSWATTSSATEWYEDGYALLTGRGLRAEVAGDSWLRAIYRQMITGRMALMHGACKHAPYG